MKQYERTFPPLVVLCLCLMLAFVLWPLLRGGFFVTDDGEWMVIRLSAFYQSLAQGQFPVRFLGRLNNSYGYPVATFLYPGFLYIGSLLRFVGLSYVDAVKVIMGASVAGASFVTYASLRARYRWKPSLVGALSYVLAPYVLFDLYHRGSVGEVLALFCGSAALFAVKRDKPWLLAPAVALLILSHNSLALMIGLVIGFLCLIHKHRNTMLLSYALGVGASAFFWAPAILERRYVRFDQTVISDPSRYFLTLENVTLLGIPTVIALALFLVRGRKRSGEESLTAGITVLGMLLSLPISSFLWQGTWLTRFFQFPYRFLTLPVLFGPYVIAASLSRVKSWRFTALSLLFSGLWVLTAVSQFGEIQFVNRPEGYYATNEGTTNVANEYMPIWVHQIPKARPAATLEIIDGDASLSQQVFAGENIRAIVDAREVSTLQINKIYYPGWGVTIDNRLIPANFTNDIGVMRVEVPNGTHTVEATFRETPFRFMTDLLSLASVIGYVLVLRKLRTS